MPKDWNEDIPQAPDWLFHNSLFPMDSIGGSSFLSLSGQRKKRTKERKPPASLARPCSGSQRRLARNSLRSNSRARIPAGTHLHCPCGAGKTSNGRGAEWDFEVGTQARGVRCVGCVWCHARGPRRGFLAMWVIGAGRIFIHMYITGNRQ